MWPVLEAEEILGRVLDGAKLAGEVIYQIEVGPQLPGLDLRVDRQQPLDADEDVWATAAQKSRLRRFLAGCPCKVESYVDPAGDLIERIRRPLSARKPAAIWTNGA